MCGGNVREYESLIFLLLYLLSNCLLRARSPSSSVAKLLGVGVMESCSPADLALWKALCSMLRRSGVIIPAHLPSVL